MAGLDAFMSNQEVKTVDASRKLRIGIIGTGWIADSHIASYKKQPRQGSRFLQKALRRRREDRLCFP